MSFLRRAKPRSVPVDITNGDPRLAALVDAVEQQDLDTIRATLDKPASHAERERLTWVLSDAGGSPDVFDAWVERQPDLPMARLARGAHGVGWAWDARGGDYAEHVTEDRFDVFHERLQTAEDDLHRAAELDPADPVPYTHLLTSGRGLEVSLAELQDRFDQAQSREQWLPEAHLQLLQGLCEKWFGSDEASLDFARKTAREAPEGAAALAVVPMAHIEIWHDMHRRDGADPAAYVKRDDVREDIAAAARRSVFADGFDDDVVTVPALNVFAVGLLLTGDEEGARALVQRLGTRRTGFPWPYFEDPDREYGELLA